MSIPVPNTEKIETTHVERVPKEIHVFLEKGIITINYADNVVNENGDVVGYGKVKQYKVQGAAYGNRMAPVQDAINTLLGESLMAPDPQAFMDAENEALSGE